MAKAKVVDSEIEKLLRKIAANKAALAERKVQVQKKNEQEDARLFSIIGAALVKAAHSPDFRLMLTQILRSAELRESDRAFLAAKGWD